MVLSHVQTDTPMALVRAMHKRPRWARKELQTDKVKGRSSIVGYDVRVQLVEGEYDIT